MTIAQENQLLVPQRVEDNLPSVVRTELAKLPAHLQDAFVEEYDRKAKGLGVAYLCSLLYCHYGFLGRWGMTTIMWIAAIASFGVISLVWWVIDLFRMPSLVRDHNHDIAMEVMRNFKTIHA